MTMADNRIRPRELEENYGQTQDSNGDQSNTKEQWVAAVRYKPVVEKRRELKPTEKGDKTEEWIRQNIKIKKCLRYAESEVNNICHCGKEKDKHTSNLENERNNSDTEPTNAFGEIQFVGAGKQTAKFVRVDTTTTKSSTILELLTEKWKVAMPNLLISVADSAKSFQESRLGVACQSSLMKAVQGTGTWIITGGRQEGVVKYVGKAVSSDEQRIITIGISPWRTIDNKHKLLKEQGAGPATYPADSSSLDPNHSHFILVDDGSQDSSCTTKEFRDELESAIATITKVKTKTAVPINTDATSSACQENTSQIGTVNAVPSNTDADFSTCQESAEQKESKTGAKCVPVVLLVLEWDHDVSETVQNAIKRNIPVIIVKASDREAYYSQTDSKIPEDIANNKLSLICEWNSESGDLDIGLAILKALSKATMNNVWDNMTNAMYQLKLSLAWNRIDIAKKNISEDAIKGTVHSLDDFMMTAILMDRMEFVELILDNGFDLENFLSLDRLLELYKKISTTNEFKVILKKMRKARKTEVPDGKLSSSSMATTNLNNKVSAENPSSSSIVTTNPNGKVPAEKPSSSSIFTTNSNGKVPAEKPSSSSIVSTNPNGKVPAEKPSSSSIVSTNPNGKVPAGKPTFPSVVKKMQNEENEEIISLEEVEQLLHYLFGNSDLQLPRYRKHSKKDKNNTTGTPPADGSVQTNADDDNPHLDLLIWSVLNNLQHMAKLFWLYGKDAMAAALLADALLSAMSRQIDDKDFQDKCEQQRCEFTKLAIGVLKECHKKKRKYAKTLLIKKQSPWEEASCVMIAVNANNKLFISQHACQDVFNNIWMGDIDEETGSIWNNLKLLLCIVFPFLILRCVEFKKKKNQACNCPATSTDPASKQQTHREKTNTNDGCQQTQETHNCHTIWKNLSSFYQAPVVIFIHNVISYMIFLGLYSYTLTSQFDRYLSWQEILLCVWVFTIFTQEIKQVWTTPSKNWKSKLLNYIKDLWNILDIATLFLFLLGMILRIFDHPQISESAHVVLGVNLVTFYLRLLHIFSVHRELGPKLVMIMDMVINLAYFFMILLVFIMAYGIASHAILYPHTEPSLATVIEIFRRPYWNIYGELMLDKIEGSVDCTNDPELYKTGTYSRCPTESGKYFVPVLMGVYMLMCNVLLLNLLIAVFSNTFQKVQDNSNLYWSFQQYSLINEYASRPFLAPPLIIFVHIYKLIKWIRTCCKNKRCEVNAARQNAFLKQIQKSEGLNNQERKMAKKCYESEMKHNSTAVIEASSANVEKRMENMEKQNFFALLNMITLLPGDTTVDSRQLVRLFPSFNFMVVMTYIQKLGAENIGSRLLQSLYCLQSVEDFMIRSMCI